MTKVKNKIAKIVTDKMIEFMKVKGLAPWFLGTATRFKHSRNCNGVSKRAFRGPTAFLTMMHNAIHGFTSPYYFTKKQVLGMGGRIKEEQFTKSCMNVGYFEVLFDKDGKETRDKSKAVSKQMRCKFWQIWNLEQLEGVDISKFENADFEEVDHEPIEEIEAILKEYLTTQKIKVTKGRPAYYPKGDKITVPDRNDFMAIFNYYCTLFHEVGHSTGHESRLNRKGITEGHKFGSEEYAYEELVAEMTAGMCLGYCGFDPSEMENSAAYIKGWLKKLQSNPDFIIKASYQAQKAFDLICPDQAPEPYEPKDKEETKKPKAKKKTTKKKTTKKKTAKTKTSTADLDKALADLQKQMEDLLKIQEEVTANH